MNYKQLKKLGIIEIKELEDLNLIIKSEKPLKLKDLGFLNITYLWETEINLSIHGNLFIYEGVCENSK